ncbi:hypothetical protein ACLB1S_20730 [Escherichia coli]
MDENNSAAGYGDGPSTAAGGFMYLGLSEVTFDIADGKTLVIGNTENDGAVDSIAGTGLITKTGSAIWYLMQITMTLLVRCRLKTVKLPAAATP